MKKLRCQSQGTRCWFALYLVHDLIYFIGLNSVFGAHLVTPDGYVLNNAMASFYNDPSLPNNLGEIAGQSPFQGLLPVIATETSGRCGSLPVSSQARRILSYLYRRSPLQWPRGSLETPREGGLFSTLKMGQMKTTFKNHSR